MKNEIMSKSVDGRETHLHFFISEPSICPSCNHAIIPKMVYPSHYIPDEGGVGLLSIMYFCSNCKHFFISEFSFDGNMGRLPTSYIRSFPIQVSSESFSKDITESFPSFVKIYNQAYAAEQMSLDEICGMGYRKALEFLIKDFIISENPAAESDVKCLMLGQCIDKFISDSDIQDLAKACAWIGNDETHYVRKHEDYSIDELKEFIAVIISMIQQKISLERAKSLISKRK